MNKVATKVTLRFDLANTEALTATQKRRLRRIAGRRVDADGSVVVTSQAERSQSQNLERARELLRRIIAKALVAPRRRVATKPSRAQKKRRLDAKRRQSEKKRQRSSVRDHD